MTMDQERFGALLDATRAFVMEGMRAHATPEHVEAVHTLLRAGARSRVVLEFLPPRLVYTLIAADGTETSVFTFATPPEAHN